jgi:hypothetical protein
VINGGDIGSVDINVTLDDLITNPNLDDDYKKVIDTYNSNIITYNINIQNINSYIDKLTLIHEQYNLVSKFQSKNDIDTFITKINNNRIYTIEIIKKILENFNILIFIYNMSISISDNI